MQITNQLKLHPMKKKSTSKSAFFNLRVLIGLCIALAGISLALAGSGTLSGAAKSIIKAMPKGKIITYSTDPLVPVGFDCSKIHELGIDKQENFRAGAIMMACGEEPGVASSATSTLGPVGRFFQRLLTPLAYGGADVNLINHPETSPNITQSETFTTVNPDNPNRSWWPTTTHAAATLARSISPVHRSPPTVASLSTASPTPPEAIKAHLSVRRAILLFYTTSQPRPGLQCGWTQAAAVRVSGATNPPLRRIPRQTSWTHFCVFSEASADRESGWADNNPSSPFFGRMYISWNDFNVAGGAIFVRYTTDNGLTWTNSRQVTTSFIRDVQITGDRATGDLYVAGMDENSGNGCSSGCGTNRNNKIYRSTDGGNTWTNTYTGPSLRRSLPFKFGLLLHDVQQPRLLAAHGLG